MLRIARLAAALIVAATPAMARPHWVAAWGAPPDQAGPPLPPQTIRQIVRVTLGGTAVRLRLSNLYGDAPLRLGSARLARARGGAAIDPASDRPVTFGGHSAVVVPKGGSVLSDPIALPVEAFDRLAVSVHLPDGVHAPTWHGEGAAKAFLVPGDKVSAADLPAASTDTSRWFLTDVEVAAAPGARLLVAAGDSITDGVGSTEDADTRWTDVLARRLHADPRFADVAVVNAGVAGNRLLNDAAKPFIGPSLRHRFARDVLDKPGARWVVILSGGNDVTASGVLKDAKDKVSAQQITDGLATLAARARARGLKVYGATLTSRGPVTGFFALSPENAAKRDAVNAWIRTSGTFDAVIDFEAALSDPARPGVMSPAYDSGDHVHPNDAGYRAMAAAIDLGLFTSPP